mmetsp:Transcript_29893/g.83543  ORF Transcript_29893/g.83543 Transcript_29893/m.83543 type:complete len:221 (+) Transcript_29893:236-898(+)|eukprot:CAMPEP_0119133286 /NCGR_PEP_ID=MMETSP1310-20130426/13296_1 /TAXON_ID=464262 /ORGANISM="Genus nov. species nov., Strain RCC2339" /LENGTH=220 /DNA_ID=CAMNT_0007123973 /DNA_START=202 /DNA_END=864 /DNA_ORIENTATION=-
MADETKSFKGQRRHTLVLRPKLDELSELSNFQPADVNKLIDVFHYEFGAAESDHGKLDEPKFKQAMAKIGLGAETIASQAFSAFDLDKDGYIDFREFIIGLSRLSSVASDEERMKLAFKVYDLDENGTISRNEMTTVLKASFATSHPEMSKGDVSVRVVDAFRYAGISLDQELDFESFRKAVKSDRDILDCFRPPKPPVPFLPPAQQPPEPKGPPTPRDE